MPEFRINLGACEESFAALTPFVRGYIEAAFFTSTGMLEDEELESASFDELSKEALASAKHDCEAFQIASKDLLWSAEIRGYGAEDAGRDFWYTRNSHGVGFWDRQELREGGYGEELSKLARGYRGVTMIRGEDGKIYFE